MSGPRRAASCAFRMRRCPACTASCASNPMASRSSTAGAPTGRTKRDARLGLLPANDQSGGFDFHNLARELRVRRSPAEGSPGALPRAVREPLRQRALLGRKGGNVTREAQMAGVSRRYLHRFDRRTRDPRCRRPRGRRGAARRPLTPRRHRAEVCWRLVGQWDSGTVRVGDVAVLLSHCPTRSCLMLWQDHGTDCRASGEDRWQSMPSQ